MKLKENVHYYINESNDKLIIRYGTKMYVIDDNDQKYYSMLKDNDIDKELSNFLYSKNLVDNFDSSNSSLNLNDRTYYYLRDRSKSTFSNSNILKNILQEKIIMIVGCGGTGTIVLDNLLRVELSNFILIDNDCVEDSNLNRQLFYDVYDIGKAKVDVLYNKLYKNFNFKGKISKFKRKIASVNDLHIVTQNIDLQNLFIVNCADTPINLDNIIGDFCTENNIPFISGYVGIESGTVGPIYDNENIYFQIDNFESKELLGSIGTNNMITGALLSQMIVDYIFKDIFHSTIDFYKRHTINFTNFEVTHE